MTAYYLYDSKRDGYLTGRRENTGGRGQGWLTVTKNILLGRAWATESAAENWAKGKGRFEVIEVTVA